MEQFNESAVDAVVLLQFIKRITTPFSEWPAFKLGIIDKDGNILKSRRTLRTQEEKNAFTLFDLLIRNIKRVIEKLPGGKSKVASYVSGLWLVREQANASWYENEDILYEAFLDFYEDIAEDEHIVHAAKVFLREEKDQEDTEDELEEDAPVNSVAGGGVAGLNVATGGPIVRKKLKPKKNKKLKFRQYIE